jgi:hypothetical protein
MPDLDKPGRSANSSIRSNVASADRRSGLPHPSCPPGGPPHGGLRTCPRDRGLAKRERSTAKRQTSTWSAFETRSSRGDRAHSRGGCRPAGDRRVLPLEQRPDVGAAAGRVAGPDHSTADTHHDIGIATSGNADRRTAPHGACGDRLTSAACAAADHAATARPATRPAPRPADRDTAAGGAARPAHPRCSFDTEYSVDANPGMPGERQPAPTPGGLPDLRNRRA